MKNEYKVIIDKKYFSMIEEYFEYWRFNFSHLSIDIDEYSDKNANFKAILNLKTGEIIATGDNFEVSSIELIRILNLLKIPFKEIE